MLARDGLSRTTSRFLTLLNKDVFGKAYQRFRKRLRVLTAIEGGSRSVRLHVHMILEIPRRFRGHPEEFFTLARAKWTSLDWAQKRVDFQVSYDPGGFAKYISKDVWRDPDALDFNNTNF